MDFKEKLKTVISCSVKLRKTEPRGKKKTDHIRSLLLLYNLSFFLLISKVNFPKPYAKERLESMQNREGWFWIWEPKQKKSWLANADSKKSLNCFSFFHYHLLSASTFLHLLGLCIDHWSRSFDFLASHLELAFISILWLESLWFRPMSMALHHLFLPGQARYRDQCRLCSVSFTFPS